MNRFIEVFPRKLACPTRYVIVPLWVILLANARAVAGDAEKPITTDAFVQYLHARSSAVSGARIQFRTVQHYGDGTEVPPLDQLGEPGIIEEWDTVYWNGLFRIERHLQRSGVDPELPRNNSHVYTWNGAESRTVDRPPDDWEGWIEACQILATPNVKQYRHAPLKWLGWWVLESSHGFGFVELFQTGTARPPRLEGNMTVWTVELSDSPSLSFEFRARQLQDHIRLESYQVNIRSLDEDRLVNSSILSFQYDDEDPVAYLSPRASIVTCRYSKRNPVWSHQSLTLKSMEEATLSEELFLEPLSEEFQVTDGRLNIGYRSGESEVAIDGRLLITHIPVRGNIAENFLVWTEGGTLVPELDPNTGNFVVPTDDGSVIDRLDGKGQSTINLSRVLLCSAIVGGFLLAFSLWKRGRS